MLDLLGKGFGPESIEGPQPRNSENEEFDRASFSKLIAGYVDSLRDFPMEYLRQALLEGEPPLEMMGYIQDNKWSLETVLEDRKSSLKGSDHASEDIKFIESSFENYTILWQAEHSIISYIIGRLSSESYSEDAPSATQRLEYLLDFARRHGEVGLQDLARTLFPEWGIPDKSKVGLPDTPSLPTEAPETYQGLRGPETPPEFVKRVYGEWLGQGLTRADIRKLDPKLAVAINNWLSRPGNEWPADVDLPTLKEQNTRWVERVKEGSAEGLTLREARRLEGVLHRRKASERE